MNIVKLIWLARKKNSLLAQYDKLWLQNNLANDGKRCHDDPVYEGLKWFRNTCRIVFEITWRFVALIATWAFYVPTYEMVGQMAKSHGYRFAVIPFAIFVFCGACACASTICIAIGVGKHWREYFPLAKTTEQFLSAISLLENEGYQAQMGGPKIELDDFPNSVTVWFDTNAVAAIAKAVLHRHAQAIKNNTVEAERLPWEQSQCKAKGEALWTTFKAKHALLRELLGEFLPRDHKDYLPE